MFVEIGSGLCLADTLGNITPSNLFKVHWLVLAPECVTWLPSGCLGRAPTAKKKRRPAFQQMAMSRMRVAKHSAWSHARPRPGLDGGVWLVTVGPSQRCFPFRLVLPGRRPATWWRKRPSSLWGPCQIRLKPVIVVKALSHFDRIAANRAPSDPRRKSTSFGCSSPPTLKTTPPRPDWPARNIPGAGCWTLPVSSCTSSFFPPNTTISLLPQLFRRQRPSEGATPTAPAANLISTLPDPPPVPVIKTMIVPQQSETPRFSAPRSSMFANSISFLCDGFGLGGRSTTSCTAVTVATPAADFVC